LDYHVAHGDDGVDGARGAGKWHFELESVPGFLRGLGFAGRSHAGRPRVDSRGRVQLLGRAWESSPTTASRRMVFAEGSHGREERDGGFCPCGWVDVEG